MLSKALLKWCKKKERKESIFTILLLHQIIFSSSDFHLSLSSCIKTGGSGSLLRWQHNNAELLSAFERFKVIYNRNTLLTSLTQGIRATKQTISHVSFNVKTCICISCSWVLIQNFLNCFIDLMLLNLPKKHALNYTENSSITYLIITIIFIQRLQASNLITLTVGRILIKLAK